MASGIDSLLMDSSCLPSIPAVAADILRLAQSSDLAIGDVSEVVARDPAIASKVLRFVNSPVYSTSQEVESIRRAIVIMGLNATMNVALSFSLHGALSQQQGPGLDYGLLWRRSIGAAISAKLIGEAAREPALEELFLAALLQDIGMLALDCTQPAFYAELGDEQRDHAAVIRYEKARAEMDHARFGAWLLRKWGLPERTVAAVQASHGAPSPQVSPERRRFLRCVSLSSTLAEYLVNEGAAPRSGVRLARDELKLSEAVIGSVLERARALMVPMAQLFEVELDQHSVLLARARELLSQRNLQGVSEPGDQAGAELLDAKVAGGEAWQDADGNAAYVESLARYLHEVFSRDAGDEPSLGLAHVHVDQLGSVKECLGGDQVDAILDATSALIRDRLRPGDVLMRYGAEEFVLVMPDASPALAQQLCRQLVESCRHAEQRLADGHRLPLTLSIGLACHGEQQHFASPEQLVRAATSALYLAKLRGRDQLALFEEGEAGKDEVS